MVYHKKKQLTFKLNKEGIYILKKCVNVSGKVGSEYSQDEVDRYIENPYIEVVVK